MLKVPIEYVLTETCANGEKLLIVFGEVIESRVLLTTAAPCHPVQTSPVNDTAPAAVVSRRSVRS